MDLRRARQTLLENDALSFAAVSGEKVITDDDYSLKPLLKLIDAHQSLVGYTAADRVVGKGGALLYVLLGASAVYSPVMSKPALHILEQYGINADYDELVPMITAFAEDGICPIEEAVEEIYSPERAENAIRLVVAKLVKAR
ncbi:hypothetical protein D2E26_1127 [Bifidobacterium dolichotidis]|uniref:DUF1893 domain-containing protein n=1 Tax=Bifidobacterium dolichotidis TaxID=2306976 RepID=A0A430FQF7_9BIFI|nr:DUF1893 domain-containing protein [Bifidobacterium dolichotidis]RSX55073.1 hypothetical protein D2E26_1127 [Bifidobacterium dolichotidis]